ncbi:MAG: energy-coupling factor transporter transmembrane component T, partial [Rhodoluna sp.]
QRYWEKIRQTNEAIDLLDKRPDLLRALTNRQQLAALTDGLRLSAIILSVAFAATFSNPRRLLKSTPAALFEIASAVSVAINLAPQLIQSVHRVRRARSLRGRSRGLSTLAGTVIPVLEDTLDKSLELAASMDSRGFGRRGSLSKKEVFVSRMLSLASILIITMAVFLLLASALPWYLMVSLLIAGVACGALSIRITSSRSNRTQHRKNKRILIDYLVYGIAAIIISAAFAGWLS